MRILFSILMVFLFLVGGFSQNECSSAILVDASNNFCQDIDFDLASYDSFNTDCIGGAELHNQWFSFQAEGPEINIIGNHNQGHDVHISLIRFTGVDCDPIKYKDVACGVNTLYLSDTLVVGETYHVIVNVDNNEGGEVEICIHNPDITPPPANDLPCSAAIITPDSTCITGTTMNAEPDSENFQCSPSYTNEVWYEFTLSEGLFFGVEVYLENISSSGDFRVILAEFGNDDCNNSFVIKQQYCGPADGLVFDYVSLIAGNTYYISIATAPEFEGDFQLCVKEMEALEHTDPCNALSVTPNDACISFDTYYSVFEYDLPNCDFSNQKIWYQFYTGTELNDISIALEKLGGQENVFLGLGYYQGNFCGNQFYWVDSYCGNVENASFSAEDLMPYQIYHIVVGTNFGFTGEFDLCINGDYNSPYTNGDPCTAYNIESYAGCVGGSSEYGSIHDQDTICYGATPIAKTWYKVALDRYDGAINIEFKELSDIPVHKVELGYFKNGCLDSFLVVQDFCGLANESVTSYDFPDSIDYAYIAVNLPTDQIYNYSICVNPIDLDLDCTANDFCQEAAELGTVTGAQPICYSACTFGTTQENTTEFYTSQFGTSWFEFTTGSNTELLELELSNATTLAYFVGILEGDICEYNAFDQSQYVQMTDFSTIRFQVSSNTTYRLALVAVDEQGGAVDVCITSKASNICQVDDRLYVTNTSMGSPLTGPFQDNEWISFCYEVNSFESVDEASCQWLQGIVPNFGNSWSASSFDDQDMPISATQIQALSNDVSWEWRQDVHSRVDNFYRRLSTGNGNAELCHIYQDNCDGEMLLQGDLLPAGWYAHNMTQSMHPDSTYGDGISCDAANGPWEICFELQVDSESAENDLEISMHTFADGEIGMVGVSDSSCMQDMPQVSKFYVNCPSQPVDSTMNISTCSGNSTTVSLPSDQYFFWFYINNERVVGEKSGSGSAISIELSHEEDHIETVTYLVKAYSQGGCHLTNYTINIDVYPALDIQRADLFTVCQDDTVSMNQIIDLESQIIGDFYVYWESDILDDLPDANWDGDEDEVIPYSVISNAGCLFADTVFIHVEDVIVEEYISEYVACRGDEVNLENVIALEEIIQDPFTVDWHYGELPDVPAVDTSFEASVKLPFTITGQTGCLFSDSLDIFVPHVAINVLGKDHYCTTDTVSISAGYEFNEEHTKYWVLSTNDTINASGFNRPADIFPAGENYLRFELFTEEGCPFYDYDTISVYDYPEFIFNQDTQYLGVCPYDSLELNISVSPSYFNVEWNTPEGITDEKSLVIDSEGWYSVEAGLTNNVVTCSNTDSFYLEVYPAVETDFTYDPIVCEGDSTVVEADNPNYKYTWSNGDFSSMQMLPPGSYSVTVSNGPGCVNIFDIDIDEQAIPAPEFEYETVLCEGDSTWISTNDEDLQYLWSTQEDSSAILSFGGEYSLTVTDSEMCTDSFDFEVEVIAYPEVEYSFLLVQDSLFLFNETLNSEDCQWTLNDDLLPTGSDTLVILPEGDYVLGLSCYNGDCGDFGSDSLSVIITGLEAQKKDSWKVYPNPNNGVFKLKNSSYSYIDDIYVFDIYGRKVMSQNINQQRRQVTLDSNLLPGIYFIHVTGVSEPSITKIIVR